MARLAAREKMQYYPTPDRVAELIASNLKPGGVGPILDPTCGEGRALAVIAARLGQPGWGCEIHPARAAAAADVLKQVIIGPREHLTISGKFGLVYDNPPYDAGAGRWSSLETGHFLADLELLIEGGLGIWVLPLRAVQEVYHLRSALATMRGVKIRRFPDPEFAAFGQVVIFGYKVGDKAHYASTVLHNELERLDVLSEGEFALETLDVAGPAVFKMNLPGTLQILTEAAEHGVRNQDTWRSLLEPAAAGGNRRPLLPPAAGHAALMIGAGLIDGTEVEADGRRLLVKGWTERRIKTTTEQVGDGAVKEIERERLVQVLALLDLATGDSEVLDSTDKTEFGEFLVEHQAALVGAVLERWPPQFRSEDLAGDLPQLLKVRPAKSLPGSKVRAMLPAQQARAAALARRLERHGSGLLVGEMSVGKTLISLAVFHLLGSRKLVVLSPANVVAKWAREARQALGPLGWEVVQVGRRCRQEHALPADEFPTMRKIAKPVLDAERAMRAEGKTVLVMSYETAKNAAPWQPAYAKRRVRLAWTEEQELRPGITVEVERREVTDCPTCPDCGELLRDKETGQPWPQAWLEKKRRACPVCGGQLWTRIGFAYGGRMALADYLNRRWADRFDLIVDEAHHFKGGDTDIGYATMDLITAARRSLAMTGTLFSGKASSLFHLLYRLVPEFRRLYDYDEVQRFVEHHGLTERITTVKKETGRSSIYGYERKSTRTREIPGATPAMVAGLLPYTAFLSLEDMGIDMPPYVEERLPVSPSLDLAEGLSELEKIRSEAVELARKGKPGLLAAWLQASLGWPDRPADETLRGWHNGIMLAEYDLSGIPHGPTRPLPKDEALTGLVETELATGRGVGVFFSQVVKRDWMPRVQAILEERGIYSEILRANTCRATERESWYRAFVKRCRARNQEPVLLANGNLLKEGLDLVELPTLIETGIDYNIYNLRQRDRRSWRIIQDKPVRVVFLYYEESWQETALALVAEKLRAALLVDGSLAEGLAAMGAEDDLTAALMKAVMSGDRPRVDWSGFDVARFSRGRPEAKSDQKPRPQIEYERQEIDDGIEQLVMF